MRQNGERKTLKTTPRSLFLAASPESIEEAMKSLIGLQQEIVELADPQLCLELLPTVTQWMSKVIGGLTAFELFRIWELSEEMKIAVPTSKRS
jgi:hypothetical protein